MADEFKIFGETVIASPGYPFYYPSDAEFTWRIQVEEGRYVTLIFASISMNVLENEVSIFIYLAHAFTVTITN